MADLSPPPRQNKDFSSHSWQDWFYKFWGMRKTRIVQTTGNPAKGSAAPTQVYLGFTSGFRFAVGDSLYFTFVTPEDWVPNTPILFDVHFYSPNVTAARYIQYQLDWAAIAIGEVITAPGSSGTLTSGDILLSTTANQFSEYGFSEIAGSNFAFHDHIHIILTRIASAGTAPASPADNPVITHFEIEYTAYINK